MFNDTGMLTNCVEGAVVVVAGCKAEECTEMALVDCALNFGFCPLSSMESSVESDVIRFLFGEV